MKKCKPVTKRSTCTDCLHFCVERNKVDGCSRKAISLTDENLERAKRFVKLLNEGKLEC